jgi:hypothetical protein
MSVGFGSFYIMVQKVGFFKQNQKELKGTHSDFVQRNIL